MKSKFTIFLAVILISILFGNITMAQNASDVEVPKLTIVTGFVGGSNYQMAMDMQRMTRKELGIPKYKIVTESKAVLNAKGDTVREEPIEDGGIGAPKFETIEHTVATGDTINFLKVLDSEGSYYNFIKINKSGTELAFIQYDVLLFEAMQDLKRSYKKTDGIRVLLPMGSEQIHIITLKSDDKKGITKFADLKGKKVGIGSSLMGTNITSKYIKEVTGMKWEDVEIPFDKSFKALFNGSIDAFFYVGAKPVKDLANATPSMKNKLTLISIPQNETLDKAYQKVTITTEDYKWLSENIETYAVRSLLVTSLNGHNAEIEANIQKLLQIVKDKKGSDQNHPNWKMIEFKKDDSIDWEYYPAALKLY
jgi:TRAP transporter TAXI family solute receptor